MSASNDSAWAFPRLSDQDNNEYDVSEPANPSSLKNSQEKQRREFKIKRLRHPTDSFLLLKFLQFLTAFVLNTVLFAICLCLCLTVLPVGLFVRKLVVSCCVRFNSRNGKLKEASSKDALWLIPTSYVNTNQKSSIFFLMEGDITIEDLREFISDKWLYYCSILKSHRFPKLRKFTLSVCSGFAWKQIENFHVENVARLSQTHELNLMLDENDQVDSSHLEQGNSSFDSGDLWKVSLFPKFLNSNDSGLLFEMHPSVSDIFPFSRLVFESLGYKTVYLKDRCFLAQRLCLYLCTAFVGPSIIIRRLLCSSAKTLLDKNNVPALCGYQKVLWSDAIDMKCVKKIKDITRTKVNVVLMSCLAGALRSYFYMCGIDHPDDIRVCLQVDMRPQHEKLRLDNRCSIVFVKLPSGTEGAVPRLWDTRRRMEELSSIIEGFAFNGFLRFCLVIFPLSFVRRIVDFILGKTSCSVTFLTGPNTPVYFNGKMAKLMTSWTPRPNRSGISLSISTHANHLRLGVVVHQKLQCDPSFLLTAFEREVENLSKHLSQRTLPSHLRWRAKQQLQMEEDREDRNKNEPELAV